MTVTSGRKSSERIGDTLKEAILSEPLTESHSSVARKYGVSDVTVRKYRLDAGLLKPATKPVTIEPQRISEKVMKAAKQQYSKLPVPPVHPEAAPSTHTITVSVTEDRADKIWQNLSLEDKALAIKTVVQAQLESF